MQLDKIQSLDQQYFMPVFGNRTPVAFTHGKGMTLYATDGVAYQDFLGGIAVTALGHSHPVFTQALKNQLDQLLHTSSLYYIENQAALAQALVQCSCADRIFFANSGAEANEGAIKLARIHASKQGFTHKYEIITLVDSFHGRTMTTVAATGQEKYQKPYAPLTPGFIHVPINDLQALERAMSDNTCAVMIECIQGESGVQPVDQHYIHAVVALCKKHNAHFVVDEIQTGMGRTGKLFAYEHFGVEPDIFTLAKALGNGIPIGAVCAKEFVAQSFGLGDHGSTFGGNAFATCAGLAVLDILKNEDLVKNAQVMGEYFMQRLLSANLTKVAQVRGKGLMIGIQLTEPSAVQVKNALFEKGFLVGSVGTNVIRCLPPLIITQADIDAFVDAFTKIIEE
ncbi:MAG: aspartate aminotransferase family protein [Hyphomonadaceae bacterium]|nr:aspartate aminotransferase family protein [Clostridia bacterium]